MNRSCNTLVVVVVSLAAAACGKSKADSGGPTSPCDAKAIETLSTDLSLASGLGLDLTDKANVAKIDAKKTQMMGTKIALAGCRFKSQGNDEVSFGADGSDKQISCTMKGGEAGVKSFRQAAMKYDMDKLKLDVRGTVGMGGMKGFEHVQPIDCVISAHE